MREIAGAVSLIQSTAGPMTNRLIKYRRELAIVAVFALVPGLLAFAFARYSANYGIRPSSSLDVDGLRIQQAVIDIGKVWSGGASVEREYTLENRTGHEISIDSVKSDCGCTVAHAVSGIVQEGKSTKIPVVFWPPNVANDRGGEFRRTITVVVATNQGRKSIHLTLAGFVEPDASLQVSPVNVEIDAPYASLPPRAILHFKGSAGLLASIPDTLLVSPGRNRRVLMKISATDQPETISTKDVQILLTENASLKGVGDWVSAVTFAPDESSDGLIVQVRGKVSPPIVASPSSVILPDDSTGYDTTVRFTSNIADSPSPDSVKSDLPLACDFPPKPSNGNTACTLRVRLKGPISADASGSIQVRFRALNAAIETISIPVVIVHVDSRGSE